MVSGWHKHNITSKGGVSYCAEKYFIYEPSSRVLRHNIISTDSVNILKSGRNKYLITQEDSLFMKTVNIGKTRLYVNCREPTR